MRTLFAVAFCLSAASCVVVEHPVIERADNIRTARMQDIQVVPVSERRPALEVVSASPKPTYIKQDPPLRRTIVRERYIDAIVTSYCPCARCTNNTGQTANGNSAWSKGIAADWTFLPEGSIVDVDGYGTHMVDDKGGLLKRKYWKDGVPKIDIRMTYHWQARNWGVKNMRIAIIRIGYSQ